MNTTVICRSDYRYAQRPASFFYAGERIQINHVLVEWCTPEGRGFKVQAEDGCFYNLFYNQIEDKWDTKEI